MFLTLKRAGVDQGEKVRRGEDGNPFPLCFAHDAEGLFIHAVIQVAVQIIGISDGKMQMEPIILPPQQHLFAFLGCRHPFLELIQRPRLFLILDPLDQELYDALLVLCPPGNDLLIKAAGMAFHPLQDSASWRDFPFFHTAQLGQQVCHVLYKINGAGTLFAQQDTTKQADWMGNDLLSMEVSILECLALMVQVIHDTKVCHGCTHQFVIVLFGLFLSGIIGPSLWVMLLHDS